MSLEEDWSLKGNWSMSKMRLNLLFQEEILSLEEDWSLEGNWSMLKMRLNLLFQEEILSLEEDWILEEIIEINKGELVEEWREMFF